MEDILSESESEQLRKVAVLQKVAARILLRRVWWLVLFFVVLSVLFSIYLVQHDATSGHRFESTTRLFYTPRQVARIENMSDKQLMSVLNRRSIKRKVGAVLDLKGEERECVLIDLDIVQEKRPSNLFSLSARAPTKDSAVSKVNAYAQALIEEYITYRERDLATWRESLDVRKQALQKQIAEIESEENTLKAKIGVIAPVETLTMLNTMLSDQRRNLSAFSVQVSNDEAKKARLESAVGKVGPLVTAHADALRRKSAEISALDAEIAKLREVYTDLNPKVVGKLDDRRKLIEAYTAFLAENGIEGVNVDDIERIAATAEELAETNMRLASIHESEAALQREIEANEKRAGELTAVIPAFDRLRVRRTDLETTMRGLDDQLENIAYLEMTIRNDLQQIEPAIGAGGKNPTRGRNFILAVAVALFGTFMLALWILAIEFVFGNVTGGRELAVYDEVTYLGALPEAGALSEAERKNVLGVLALKVVDADVPKGVILVCRLPGVPPQPEFRESLDWTLSMAGRSSVRIDIVPSAEFSPPEDAETFLVAAVKGEQGWFPVENRYKLAPAELQMLQADLEQLRTRFDHIFISVPDGTRRGGSFLDQLLTVCDCVLLGVAARRTPRNWLSYVRHHFHGAGKPILGIATGEKARIVRREMEAVE